MTTRHNRLRGMALQGFLAGAGLAFGAAGCGKTPSPESTRVEQSPTDAGAPAQNDTDSNANSASIMAVNFDESFEDAAITEVLEGHQFPPDVTIGGMKTGPLRVAIENSWPKIKLKDASGKVIPYILKLETDDGQIEIKLRAEIAPNHVRNLLALARAGFYNGLKFERNIHQESEAENVKVRLDMLIAGCPTGTGDDGFGHIGYFVRSESQQEMNLKHEEGTVGFYHEEDPDSSGTRFYITLGAAPALDGKFTIIGSVAQGLEVVRKIAAEPRMSAEMSPENERPVKPVEIRSATVIPDPLGE